MSDATVRLNRALEGRYLVERLLGQGGMAAVYLARDLRHDRRVAVKVLRSELTAVLGAERFVAEIRTTASLQHPHILPLFDSGVADGMLFYVMPLVDGESLRQRLDREHQLPIDEAVRVVTGVAEALDYAHRHGVIHRDVKPANILLQDGKPVVADFGIALAVGAAGGGRLTETGLSLGTPHYMSPEQAAGDEGVGTAADIYALGCVLYEVLAGEPPYTGRTPQAVLGKIIQGHATPIGEHRPRVPLHVAACVERALEKVPADRFGTAGDMAAALADPAFRHRAAHAPPLTWAGRTRGVTAGWVAAGAVALAIVAWSVRQPAPSPPSVARHVLSTEALLDIEAPFGLLADVAANGSALVLPVGSLAAHRLARKLRGSTELMPIAGTEGARNVRVSPDGTRIVYVAGGQLFSRDLTSGSSVAIAGAVDNIAEAIAWLDDGTLLYEEMTRGEGAFVARIVRIPQEGGGRLQVVEVSEADAGFPIWMDALPDARGALVVTCEGIATCTAEVARLYVLDLPRGSLELLEERVIRAWYDDGSGHLIVVRPTGAVFAIPFDLRSLSISGGAIPLFEGVRVGASQADMLMSAEGTVLYVEGQTGLKELVWVDRAGRSEPLDPELGARGFTSLSLSPDDHRLAVSIESVQSSEIWVKEIEGGPIVRLTEHAGTTRWPSWSADGTSILYINNEGGTPHVRAVRADGGSGTGFEVLLRRDLPVMEAVSTPDGLGFVFREGQPSFSQSRVGMMRVNEVAPVAEPIASGLDEQSIALSPDGRWLAYVSTVTGRWEVYVRRTDGSGGRTQVSTSGGSDPVWAHTGPELFFRGTAPDALTSATYTAEPGFRILARTPLFDASPYWPGIQERRAYDVTSDDARFVMVRPVPGGARLVLIEGWQEELRARVGG